MNKQAQLKAAMTLVGPLLGLKKNPDTYDRGENTPRTGFIAGGDRGLKTDVGALLGAAAGGLTFGVPGAVVGGLGGGLAGDRLGLLMDGQYGWNPSFAEVNKKLMSLESAPAVDEGYLRQLDLIEKYLKEQVPVDEEDLKGDEEEADDDKK